jgi:chemotaxis protein CheZ
LKEILEILGPSEAEVSPPTGDEPSPEPEPVVFDGIDEAGLEPIDERETDLDFTHLSELVRSWGGELTVDPNGDSGAKFSLTFRGSADSLQKVEKLLSSREPAASEHSVPDEALENLISKGKEFFDAFSIGDMDEAQKVLLNLADQQRESTGLYKEIGGLARGLHDSIRSFIATLDPSLNEIVKDKIPDSGNRLEHILDMTEKAAITTLDHVESMQERLSGEMEKIATLRGIFGGLHAIGDSAGRKLDQADQTLNAMEALLGENRSDLDVILTAQDYQDLSGQIILKITQLLKDIESKLVNLIRTFGAKTETPKQKECSELYGPVHAGVENAVHSQDEVDSMLAEFGF